MPDLSDGRPDVPAEAALLPLARLLLALAERRDDDDPVPLEDGDRPEPAATCDA